MARTRSQKEEKAQGKPSRERRLENATHAEEAAAHRGQLEEPVLAADGGRMEEEEFTKAMKKKMKKCQEDNKIANGPWKGEVNADGVYPCPFEGCLKTFARRADYQRHRNSCHCKLRLYRCKLGKCIKAYAQKGSLDNHVKRCKHRPFRREGDGIRPCICPPCPKTFSDPSSLLRHVREQHKRRIYQCPFESCKDHLGEPKCVKRCSGFKQHMIKKHKYPEDKLTKGFCETCRVTKGAPGGTTLIAGPSMHAAPDETTLVAGPSMHADSDALLSNDGDFAAAAPPYSLTPRLGETPLLFVPHSESYASTPGLSSPGLSPSPGVSEATYDDLTPSWVGTSQPNHSEELTPSFYMLPENPSGHSSSTGSPGYTPGPYYGAPQNGYLYPTPVSHGNAFQQSDPPEYVPAMHAPDPSCSQEGYGIFMPAWPSAQHIGSYGMCSPENQPTHPLQPEWLQSQSALLDPYLLTQPQMIQQTAPTVPAFDPQFTWDSSFVLDQPKPCDGNLELSEYLEEFPSQFSASFGDHSS